MKFVEYAEKISQIPLTEWQKEFLKLYEQAKEEDKYLIVHPARNIGRTMIIQIINELENNKKFKDYRCSCGRLLGKFNGYGQAEIKCPKCGKVNAIDFGVHFNEAMKKQDKTLWRVQYQQEPISFELKKD